MSNRKWSTSQRWKFALFVTLLITTVDLIIPDPIPLVDEILLIILDAIFTYKSYGGKNK